MPAPLPPVAPLGDGPATIARLLAAKGWTQAQLAEAVGVSQGHLSYVLRGERVPSDAMVAACVRALTALDSEGAA